MIELTEGESGVERSGDREEQIFGSDDETGNAENSGSDSSSEERTNDSCT